MLGQVEVEVTAVSQTISLIFSGEVPSLFGWAWIMKIKLNWKEIYTVAEDDKLAELLNTHSTLFKPGLGTLNGYKAKICLNSKAKIL